jgi:hypothetical protein
MTPTNLFILLVLAASLKSSPFLREIAPRQVVAATQHRCVLEPRLTALFTPQRPELGRYDVCTTDEPLPDDAEALEPLDAFGAAGPYDRAALQRLYGGRRVRVERRWIATSDEFVAITRLSPYPDATLTRLHTGTLEIRWHVIRP